MLIIFMAYLLSGIFIGFFAGLFGVGGGIIGIPVLFYLFSLQHFPENNIMHLAVGTMLSIGVMTTSASILAHHRKGKILFPVLKKIVFGAMMGSIIGIIIARHLQGAYLQHFFGAVLLLIATQLVWLKSPEIYKKLPHQTIVFGTTILFGTLTGMLGLGGGVFMVPYLYRHGISMHNAIATSTACILPVLIVGTLGYMIPSNALANLSLPTVGFMCWPAFLGVSITSMIFAPIGVHLTHRLSRSAVKRIFSLFLVISGLSMLV